MEDGATTQFFLLQASVVERPDQIAKRIPG